MQRPQFLLHKRHLSEFPFKVDLLSNSMQLTLISYEYTYVHPLSLRSFYATRPGPVPAGGIPRHGGGGGQGGGCGCRHPCPFVKFKKRKRCIEFTHSICVTPIIFAIIYIHAQSLNQKNGNSTLTLRLVTRSLSYLIRMGNGLLKTCT